MIVKTLIVLIVAVSFSQVCFAEIYRWVDEAGNTIYSDKPNKKAEKVELPGLSSYASQPAKQSSNNSKNADEKQARYSTFKISQPANDATIRDNTGRVVVLLEMTPALLKGDTVVFDIDGQIVKKKAAQILFNDVVRGAHTIKAYIIDSAGKTVTPVSTAQFHMKRASVLSRPKPQAP